VPPVAAARRRLLKRDFHPGPTPPEFSIGEKLYADKCRRCHGERALGTQLGPPLVHEYYAPAHHAEAAFIWAVMLGVQEHHWTFGPMAAMADVGEAQARLITGYVRWLQRKAGIYSE
jgi:mono/diheme cytochrome c family protein